MLLVKTKIGPSKIEGTGLFADEYIKKGQIIWQWAPNLDIRINPQDLECMVPIGREAFLRYSYLSKRTNLYILCFDNGRFINHSENPNVRDISSIDHEEGLDIAMCNIEPGTELVCNYLDFDLEAKLKIYANSHS